MVLLILFSKVFHKVTVINIQAYKVHAITDVLFDMSPWFSTQPA